MAHSASPFVVLAALTGAAAAQDFPLRPPPLSAVELRDAFFAPRLATARSATLPHVLEQCERTGRIANFARAGGLEEGGFRGRYPFDDTDVYKTIEGAAYHLAMHPDAGLEERIDELIAVIDAAQEEDGYLYTARTLGAEHLRNWYGDGRYARLRGSHELYNVGHLLEAACAWFEATGKRNLLEVAIEAADRVAADFGPRALHLPSGHQEIEIGLARLFRVTGDRKYLGLAEFLLRQRGDHSDRRGWGEYCQDHAPVLEQTEATGHAVRAAYMYAAMAEMAALTGEETWCKTLEALWRDVVGRKLYVTGGIGASGAGEAFGRPWHLPNVSAYSETCASMANVFWNHRMFLLTGDGRYVDVLERSLYNAVLSGVSLDGTRFFYPNPLASFGTHARSPWFACACCPSNAARFAPSIGRYVYAARGDQLWVNLFAAGEATFDVGGERVRLTQETDHPWDGRVAITVQPESERELELRIRVPGWALGKPVPSELYVFAEDTEAQPALALNGEPVALEPEEGYAVLRRRWRPGDRVVLDLPMPVRRLTAHPEVDEDRGKVALQRGPLVYCVEGTDYEGGHVAHLLLDDTAELRAEHRPDLLAGLTVITGTVRGVVRAGEGEGTRIVEGIPFTAIPYYAWAHRGRANMAVWLAREPDAATPPPAPTLAYRAVKTASHHQELAAALGDQMVGASSADKSLPFFHWWPRFGSVEWAQYEFPEPARVRACEVYWLRDVPNGGCDLPTSWRILWQAGDEWRPVENASGYGTELDAFNRVEFDPVTTKALRLEVQLKEGRAAGAHEWIVEEAKER